MKNMWGKVAIALVWLPAIAAIGLSIQCAYYITFLLVATPVLVVLSAIAMLTIRFLRYRGLVPKRRWIKRSAILSGLCVVLVYTTQFPFYFAYWSALPQLEAIAAEVRSNPKQVIQETRQAGLFKIVKAGLSYQGSVYLWTNLNNSGNEGFIQCQTDKTSEDDCLTHTFVSRRLSDRWYLQLED